MKNLFVLFHLCLFAGTLTAQPNILWAKTFGGSLDDVARAIQPTDDGGFILAGSSQSIDGDVSGNQGEYDCWVVKLSEDGIIEWQKPLGGSGYDVARSIIQTADGGYLMGGTTDSNDGDVSGNHGELDFWLVKLDQVGEIEWQKTLGGSSSDIITSIGQTSEGGYIVSGWSFSNDGDVSGHHGGVSGSSDIWVGKLSSTGLIEWQNSLGGSSDDNGHSIQQTSDGGYIVAGQTSSLDGDVVGFHGTLDCWIIKLNANGQIQWQRPLGGSGDDITYSIQQTSDGGYITAGFSRSGDGDVTRNINEGDQDFWVVKLSQRGAIQWKKSLGGSSWDEAIAIQQTSEGGYVVVGKTISSNKDVSVNNGYTDIWVVGLSNLGAVEWEKSLGGADDDEARTIKQLSNGGFIIAGITYTSADLYDCYVIKLSGF